MTVRIHQGHVIDVLRGLSAGSWHLTITSPPYWGLRDYGLPPVEWPAVSYAPMAGLPPIHIAGCEEGCQHRWGDERIITNSAPRDHNGAYAFGDTRGQESHRKGATLTASQGQFCQLCGGWRGSLGLEPTIEMYVGHLVLVARELWRVLRIEASRQDPTMGYRLRRVMEKAGFKKARLRVGNALTWGWKRA